MNRINKFIISFSLSCFTGLASTLSFAGPWYTGPVLAAAGHTIPKGHTNVEFYSFNTGIIGVYDDQGTVHPIHKNRSYSTNAIISHGLTDKIDVQAVFAYNFNYNTGAHSQEPGDTTIGLGYQILEQKDKLWRPDIRFTVQEILPTGPYQHLNPNKLGTDSSGLGAYQTAFSINLQNVQQLTDTHYLRTRFTTSYLVAQDTHVQGLSAYGGTLQTQGTANPGDSRAVDLATELSLTQNWVAVMEVNASKRNASRFKGMTGIKDMDDFDTIGHEVGKQVSLAPALEFNFTPTVGLIGGVWFPVYGRSTPKFVSYDLALNAFW